MSLVLVSAALASLVPSVATDRPIEIKVLEAMFVAQDLTEGRLKVYPATHIKYVPGKSCYSWYLRVEPQDVDVTVTEQFKLPAPASHWGSPDAKVSTDRSSAATEIQESLSDGLLTNGWCVAEGDPVGKHVIDVSYQGRLLHQFSFAIEIDSN